MLLENAGAGSGRHVLDLSKGLINREHRVHLLYSPYRLEKSFEIGINAIEGLTTFQVPMMRGPNYRDIKGIKQINRYIRTHGEFDIVHGHSSKGGAIARIVGSMNTSVRIYTPHAFYTLDPGLSTPKQYFYRTLERILAKFSDGIICVSQDEYKHALSLPISPEKLFLVNNGIAPLKSADRQSSRRRLGIGKDELCIGFVGRLAPQKSLGRLIHAFSKVYNQLPSARLAIVGDGPDKVKMQTLASSLNVGDRIIWAGQGDGPDLMAGFDVFAMSSRYEAFPYVLLEAAARGLPIITTHVGGAHEIISSGKSGFISEQHEDEKYFSYILRLCENPKKREEMSHHAKESIKKFSVDRMVSETIDVYTACLKKSARSRNNMKFSD